MWRGVLLVALLVISHTRADAQRSGTGDGMSSTSGIPHRPDAVTIIPFYTKPDETPDEQTKVAITAKVDRWRGVFIVDLGDPYIDLNRTFLQPTLDGGIDSVTDANQHPDTGGYSPVWVTLTLGTLIDHFTVAPGTYHDSPGVRHHSNAVLGHSFGNFSWNFAPRLGNLGLAALEQYETIIDYTHQRLVLIRLDAAGHRLVPVPAYMPRWSAPLLDLPLVPGGPAHWWGIAVQEDGTLDTVDIRHNTVPRVIDTGAPQDGGTYNLLGYPFLSGLGVVGFNHRTHRVVLYRTL